MRIELAQECDYEREAQCCQRMRDLLGEYPDLYVPKVIPELSTKQVFVTEMIQGTEVKLFASLLKLLELFPMAGHESNDNVSHVWA